MVCFPYSSTTISSQTVTATIKVEFYANNRVTRAANIAAGTPDSSYRIRNSYTYTIWI